MTRVLGALAAHLASNSTTLASCWRIVRTDGEIFTFTDADTDLVVGGEVYLSKQGFRRSAVSNVANGAVDNVELDGAVDSAVTDLDIRRGLWDYAEVRIFVVNWQNAETGGQANLRRGWMGELSATDTGTFTTELRGLTQVLSQTVGQIYTPECRAHLGDARCTVDLSGYTTSGSIGEITSNTVFVTGLGAEYEGGVFHFTSGLNEGVRREILISAGTSTLFLPPPYIVAPGDAFTATQGCDKRLATCRDKFANVLNFRGEPFIPGADRMLFVGMPTDDPGGGKK